MTLQRNSIQELYQITLPGTASNDITKKFNSRTISNNMTRYYHPGPTPSDITKKFNSLAISNNITRK